MLTNRLWFNHPLCKIHVLNLDSSHKRQVSFSCLIDWFRATCTYKIVYMFNRGLCCLQFKSPLNVRIEDSFADRIILSSICFSSWEHLPAVWTTRKTKSLILCLVWVHLYSVSVHTVSVTNEFHETKWQKRNNLMWHIVKLLFFYFCFLIPLSQAWGRGSLSPLSKSLTSILFLLTYFITTSFHLVFSLTLAFLPSTSKSHIRF